MNIGFTESEASYIMVLLKDCGITSLVGLEGTTASETNTIDTLAGYRLVIDSDHMYTIIFENRDLYNVDLTEMISAPNRGSLG